VCLRLKPLLLQQRSHPLLRPQPLQRPLLRLLHLPSTSSCLLGLRTTAGQLTACEDCRLSRVLACVPLRTR
jgi:hypothetical protein